jgi:hypothetical protein
MQGAGAASSLGAAGAAADFDPSQELMLHTARNRPMKLAKLPTRKTVQYENCRILAPDGTTLCTCGSKKISWYLSKGLAVLEEEEPLTIRLKFEPRGRGHADDAYYLSDKENRCCVCGHEGQYLRHSVVPHAYRQHFPPQMKSHLSHDIVLMCVGCHQRCNLFDTRRMQVRREEQMLLVGSAQLDEPWGSCWAHWSQKHWWNHIFWAVAVVSVPSGPT